MNGAQRAPGRSFRRLVAATIVLVALLGVGNATTNPAPVRAAVGPKVAIIVGPAGWQTASNKTLANAAATEARRYTPNVVKVYSPNATWSRVKAAITNASVVLYLGVGFGWPSPDRTNFKASVQDGFALNPVAGLNNSTIRYYGESYIRTTRLATHAVVLLSRVWYASGNSRAGTPAPTVSIARKRVDNYGAGFLAVGAAAVIAEYQHSPSYYVRAIFTRNASLDAVWRQAPFRHGHVTSFSSVRRPGAVGRTDPLYAWSGFYRSIIGWPATTTSAVRLGIPQATAPLPSAPPAPSGGKTVTVSSIPALLANLADDSVGQIVVANGTYHVSPANDTASDSLWIGAKFAGRTRPILVMAQTRGHVIFDGGGGSGYSGLSFEAGAHDQTWDGFVFANMRADHSGIIEIAGYVPLRAPHNITLRFITVTASCRGGATSASAPATEHAIYVANAAGVGPNHLLLEDISVDGTGGLASAIQFDHGDATNPNASYVTVRRLHVIGTQQAVLFWTPAVHYVTFDSVTIQNAIRFAVRFESLGASAVVLSNIVSTGSGEAGFYSSMGSRPPGLTFTNASLR
jgi:hypothetical protein